MNSFSIRDMENLSGIKAHTLRIWEQRYNLLRAKRRESLHRFYDNNDLKQLLRISHLYNRGYRISHIARLSHEEIRMLTMELREGEDHFSIYINQLTEASIDFDQPRFEKVLHHIVLHHGFEKCMTSVIFPFLEKIGRLWLTGNVIPAQEHFASALIIKKIIIATDGLESKDLSGAQLVVIFSPEKEMHEIPLLMVRYLMKKNGIRHLYAGCNVGMEVLEDICQQQPVSHLYFHLITNLTRYCAADYLRNMSKAFPGHRVICSGSQLSSLAGDIPNVAVLEGLGGVKNFIEGLQRSA